MREVKVREREGEKWKETEETDDRGEKIESKIDKGIEREREREREGG